ncbi:MAG: carbonic anhydrase [Planctomycetota bacterium]|jgi:carbonic anhydrase/acetyltransferase-like protein (isoleucine patch superfamily)
MSEGTKSNRMSRRDVLKGAALGAAGAGMVAAAGRVARADVDSKYTNRMPNVRTSFNVRPTFPDIHPSGYVHPLASVIGAVTVGRRVLVSPSASIRGDEGTPIYIGDFSNVQDGVVVHALETSHDGKTVKAHLVEVARGSYAVYVDVRVSLAHQACIHGPALVGHDTFVGMQALVFNARVGGNCVIEPGAKVFGREGMITVPDGRYVKAGSVVTTQSEADALPEADSSYPYAKMNRAVVGVNVQLADAYNEALAPKR